MRKVYGKGVNDSKTPVQKFYKTPDGKSKLEWICPYYKKWQYMLQRALCPKLKEKQPTYKGVSVCEEWLYFSKFRSWCVSYENTTNISIKDYCLDKDIISTSNKVYSPDTCCFVTSDINNFMTDNAKNRGLLPLGVTFSRGKYKAVCSNPFDPKYKRSSASIFLGRWDCEYKAHMEYCNCKYVIAEELKRSGKLNYDLRIAESIINKFKNLKDNAENLYKDNSQLC